MEQEESTFHINPNTEGSWSEASKKLPKTLIINGTKYKTSELSDKTKKLALIYINDSSIVSQFKELLALAELGLSTISKEVQETIEENS